MNRATWIALVVFLVLGSIVILTRQEQIRVGVHELKIPKLNAAELRTIEIRGKVQVRLEHDTSQSKITDGWRVMPLADDQKSTEKSESFEADPQLIQSFVDLLPTFSTGTLITDRVTAHSEYQIDDANALRVKLIRTQGEPIELLFGKTSRDGGSYVRAVGSIEVFSSKGNLAAPLRRDVSAWRSKTINSLQAEDISSIVIFPEQGEHYQIIPKANNAGWSLDGISVSKDFHLDEATLEKSVQLAAVLRAQDFAPTTTDAVAVGLGGTWDTPNDPQVPRVEIQRKSGEPIRLRFGIKDDKGRRYVQKVGDPQIYICSDAGVTQLVRPWQQLRDLRLFAVDPKQINSLQIQSGDTKIDAILMNPINNTWELKSPESVPVGKTFNTDTLQAALRTLTSWKASRYADGNKPPQIAVKKPTKVRITTRDERIVVVTFGKNKDERTQYVNVDDGVSVLVYEVSVSLSQRLQDPWQLFVQPTPPPAGGGGLDLNQLPPEIRQQIEAQMRAQTAP